MVRVAEQWRQVPDFPQYEISDRGRLRHGTRQQIRKPFVTARGELRYTLTSKANRSAHQLVAAAFIGPCPAGKEIDHVDGKRSNNRPANLEYVTRSQNNRRAFALGLRVGAWPKLRGSAHGRARLTEANVKAIRRRHAIKPDNVGLARKYGVSLPTIEAIVYRRTWKHLA